MTVQGWHGSNFYANPVNIFDYCNATWCKNNFHRKTQELYLPKPIPSCLTTGTWRGGRTLTLVKELDFESSASANSAIQANKTVQIIVRIFVSVNRKMKIVL